MTEQPIHGLVLAGGKSSRMGQDKALLRHNGKSQLEILVDILTPAVDRVFVSTRPDQVDEPERRKFAQIVDRYSDIGPIAGVLSAMEEHADTDWLVVACDLPNIDAATIQYLLEHRSSEAPFTAFRSTHDDLPEPLCAIYRAGSDAIVRQFVDDGIRCPRKMLIRSDTRLLVQPNPRSLDNVNTPEDLRASVLEGTS